MTKSEFLGMVSRNEFNLPRTTTLATLEEPVCPACLCSDPKEFLLSAIPKRTGLRGNPILECRTCRKTFSYPRMSGGRPLTPPKVWLTRGEVEMILGCIDNYGRYSVNPYVSKLNRPVNRKEIQAIISLTSEEYQNFMEQVSSGQDVREISLQFPVLNYDLTSTLLRAELSRRGHWA